MLCGDVNSTDADALTRCYDEQEDEPEDEERVRATGVDVTCTICIHNTLYFADEIHMPAIGTHFGMSLNLNCDGKSRTGRDIVSRWVAIVMYFIACLPSGRQAGMVMVGGGRSREVGGTKILKEVVVSLNG